MSVLIRRMEMPKDCFSCKLKEEGFCNVIGIVKYTAWIKNERHKDCPLVEVATPHGNLIDASVLHKQITQRETSATAMVEQYTRINDKAARREWGTILKERVAFEFDVADAPVVVEAEGEG